MKALSLLTQEEPIKKSGKMLRSIQAVDFSGSEWKCYERKLWLILFGSWVKSKECPSVCSVKLQDLLSGLLGPAKLPSCGTKKRELKGSTQERLLLPWMFSGTAECSGAALLYVFP